MRVLFVYRNDVDLSGGAAVHLLELANALRRMGHSVDVSYDLYPEPSRHDLVHVWNIWHPRTALPQLRHLRKAGTVIVWSPIYLHFCEYVWASAAVRVLYGQVDVDERERFRNAFREGGVSVGGRHRWGPNEIYPGFFDDATEMLSLVDHVCVLSYHEAQKLFTVTRAVTKPFTVTPIGVDRDGARESIVSGFRPPHGDEFVLSVGSVDGRKNQLFLIEALRGTGLRIVLVGPAFESDYLELCLIEGMGFVEYLGRLPRSAVVGAYLAARVHALPSYAEGAALSNLEAAAWGCAIVVSNRSSEFEYFGDSAYYCDPGDPECIRRAVLAAWESRKNEPERWLELSERVSREYTWDRAAACTAEAYKRALGGRPADA